MKIMVITAALLWFCASAFAESHMMYCNVEGDVKMMNSASDCAALGGTMQNAENAGSEGGGGMG